MKTKQATKAQVIELAKYYGCIVEYSGNNKIAYIKGDNNKEAIQAIRSRLNPIFSIVEG